MCERVWACVCVCLSVSTCIYLCVYLATSGSIRNPFKFTVSSFKWKIHDVEVYSYFGLLENNLQYVMCFTKLIYPTVVHFFGQIHMSTDLFIYIT